MQLTPGMIQFSGLRRRNADDAAPAKDAGGTPPSGSAKKAKKKRNLRTPFRAMSHVSMAAAGLASVGTNLVLPNAGDRYSARVQAAKDIDAARTAITSYQQYVDEQDGFFKDQARLEYRERFLNYMQQVMQSVEGQGTRVDYSFQNLTIESNLSASEIEYTDRVISQALKEDDFGKTRELFMRWFNHVAPNHIKDTELLNATRSQVSHALDEIEQTRMIDDIGGHVTTWGVFAGGALFVSSFFVPGKKKQQPQ